MGSGRQYTYMVLCAASDRGGALVYIQLHGGWLPSTWLPLSESVVKNPHLQKQQPSCQDVDPPHSFVYIVPPISEFAKERHDVGPRAPGSISPPSLLGITPG